MIENIYNNINNLYIIDIISFLLEYIKNNLFNKYLKYIFEILENNNILTTFLEIKRNNYKYINHNIVKNIINKYLNEITIEKNCIYTPKFLFYYNIPGFFNFYINISNYINKNISLDYYKNEKRFRDLLEISFEKNKDFHEKEESLLSSVYQEIKKDKFIFEIIYENKIEINLILQDYITYYLQKYKNKDKIFKNDDIYHKLIELLLKLRFDDKKIIKENENSQINILSIKILWIESNINYILNILKIIEFAIEIFNDEKKLYKEIDELIHKKNIKYIAKEGRNPEHTKEVNECYYILLASICYSITSDKIILSYKEKENEIEIYHYYIKLKEIIKILDNLNNELYIYLNEIYIIDELIKVIELLNYNIEKINKIKNSIRESDLIIQKYAFNENKDEEFSEELINNFGLIYDFIIKEEKYDKDFYDNIRYLLFRYIKKINIGYYRYLIFKKLIEENQMIKKSNDIFKFFFRNIEIDEYYINYILNSSDEILRLIEEQLKNNNFVLSETLLYFFEKNSLKYLKINTQIKKKSYEDQPFAIFEKCIHYLNYYIYKPEKVASKLKEIGKLFCLSYIKSYIFTFIKILNDNENMIIKIIDIINENNSINKMLHIYIYKILYNKYKIDAFINEEIINKYKLKDYKDFETLIKKDELINIYKIDYKVKTLNNEFYNNSYLKLEKYQKEGFKKKIKKKDFDIQKLGIDNFYIISYNIILSDLKWKNDKFDINSNFYHNICKPLFIGHNLLSKAIELIYDPNKYEEIKNCFHINSDNIIPILYGYRYILNELSYENKNGIYYSIYIKNNFNYYISLMVI